MDELTAPFTYFGGKGRAADLIWERFGNVDNYCEPFAGSLAVLLRRPSDPKIETVNDLCGFISNFWRSISKDPEAVAGHADHPVNEIDIHARHSYLVGIKEELANKLEGDPEYFDAKAAGWWVHGKSAWIGSGYCEGKGPWHVIDGKLVNTSLERANGINRKLPQLGGEGRGVNRKLPNLTGNGQGVNRQLPQLGGDGRGINRQMPNLTGNGQGVNRQEALFEWFAALGNRLRKVRVCCGDWSRLTGPSVTTGNGVTGFFADPPYSAEEDLATYYRVGDSNVAKAVFDWAIANGDNPLFRICVAGYEGEHPFPDSWQCVPWHAQGGYGGQRKDGKNENNKRERLWFSRYCLKPELDLFAR